MKGIDNMKKNYIVRVEFNGDNGKGITREYTINTIKKSFAVEIAKNRIFKEHNTSNGTLKVVYAYEK